jgi:hypothetical protein
MIMSAAGEVRRRFRARVISVSSEIKAIREPDKVGNVTQVVR